MGTKLKRKEHESPKLLPPLYCAEKFKKPNTRKEKKHQRWIWWVTRTM